MGLDHRVADDFGGASHRDFSAREVPKSAAFVLDSTIGLALLDGLRGFRLASTADRQRDLDTALDNQETLIEKRISQNIARWAYDRRDEVVSER